MGVDIAVLNMLCFSSNKNIEKKGVRMKNVYFQIIKSAVLSGFTFAFFGMMIGATVWSDPANGSDPSWAHVGPFIIGGYMIGFTLICLANLVNLHKKTNELVMIKLTFVTLFEFILCGVIG